MKEIIYTSDKAYQLVRVLKEDRLKNPDMEILKEYFLCDTLLRKQGKLYFCRLIEEIKYEINRPSKTRSIKIIRKRL